MAFLFYLLISITAPDSTRYIPYTVEVCHRVVMKETGCAYPLVWPKPKPFEAVYYKTLEIDPRDLYEHLDHGDTEGPCKSDERTGYK